MTRIYRCVAGTNANAECCLWRRNRFESCKYHCVGKTTQIAFRLPTDAGSHLYTVCRQPDCLVTRLSKHEFMGTNLSYCYTSVHTFITWLRESLRQRIYTWSTIVNTLTLYIYACKCGPVCNCYTAALILTPTHIVCRKDTCSKKTDGVALTFFRSLKMFRLTFLRMRNKCKLINVQRNNKAFSA